MQIVQTIDFFISSAMIAVVVAAIVLILLRSLFKYMDVNPFTWSAITVKRLTDPVVLPEYDCRRYVRADQRKTELVNSSHGLFALRVDWSL